MQWKGIVLAGGSGTRLAPVTQVVSKQLLPVYDKPMIFYSLSLLMLAGIREIAIISTPHDIGQYQQLLGDGAQYGVSFTYLTQPQPDGLAQAFLLGETFIGSDNVALVLGDNVMFGHGLTDQLRAARERERGATVFAYAVKDPSSFAVVTLDGEGNPISIDEKPAEPKSRYAVPGLYFYDNNVVGIAHQVKPSPRGELEITDVNRAYLAAGELNVEVLGRGYAWLDAGTHDSLIAASLFVQTVEARQRFKIACLEEIAFTSGWIGENMVRDQASRYKGTDYGAHLLELLEGPAP